MEERSAKHIPPTRTARYTFGQVLERGDFRGRISSIYADYWAALEALAVPSGWFEMQSKPISTKDQIFYGVIAMNGFGAALFGENDATLVEGV